ncbi:MAG: hypothetical protein ACRDXX_07850, partial [Stackebrandtia sp.]
MSQQGHDDQPRRNPYEGAYGGPPSESDREEDKDGEQQPRTFRASARPTSPPPQQNTDAQPPPGPYPPGGPLPPHTASPTYRSSASAPPPAASGGQGSPETGQY